MAVLGARELHNRFSALLRVPGIIEESWAGKAAPRIREDIPQRTGATARSVRPTRQGVVGSPVVTFLDRGTRAHVIEPSRKRALKFNARTGTVFSRKAAKPQMRGRNFVEPAAREALDEVGNRIVIDTWNRAG